MKLSNCIAKNFGSYQDLEFDFSDLGLSLVYGPTGSGKSTLCDIACWALYGITAKDGSADEVRSWQTPDEPTTVELIVELPQENIQVTRIRGKANQNDLYWQVVGKDTKTRGKDLIDTQRLLEEKLGVSSDLFLAGSYYCEFNPVASFFVAKASDRRAVFEKVASLALPIKLAERTSNAKKETKKALADAEIGFARESGILSQLMASFGRATEDADIWKKRQSDLIEELQIKSNNFEKEKASKIAALQTKSDAFNQNKASKIDEIAGKMIRLEETILNDSYFTSQIRQLNNTAKCESCGGSQKSVLDQIDKLRTSKAENDRRKDRLEMLIRDFQSATDSENPYLPQLADAAGSSNHYLEQLENALVDANPYKAQATRLERDIANTQMKLEAIEGSKASLQTRYSALNHLYDLSFDLRGAMLLKAVREIQDETNRCLETYFDAELRVSFTVSGGDSLDVSIQKNGYECTFRQLSKGQRQLLRLSFCVSVMKAAANQAGINFDTLFFDEALDGLDNSLKVKAFDLFQELEKSHGTVLLIDHAVEFQSLFSKRYSVNLDSDVSSITAEE